MSEHDQRDWLATLRAWLIEDGWTPEPLKDGRTLGFVFAGDNAEIFVYVHVPAALDVLVVYGACPFTIPDDTLAAAEELVTRLNYGMLVGCLELSLEDGDLRFKSSLDFRGTGLTHEMFRNVLLPAAWSMDRYVPVLRRLVVEQKSALEVLGGNDN
jgi:hypothetical protein